MKDIVSDELKMREQWRKKFTALVTLTDLSSVSLLTLVWLTGNFNTWLGDPVRALQLQVIADVIRNDHLVENVRITGRFLFEGIQRVTERYPHVILNLRGPGTFIAYGKCEPDAPQQEAVVSPA